MFGKRRADDEATLSVRTEVRTVGGSVVPMVTVSGRLADGSEGNLAAHSAFETIVESVDLSRSDIQILGYDFTRLTYDFGDHLAAFLWVLPAVMDGVALMVTATGSTRERLESLAEFVGDWLPLAFSGSAAAIETAIAGRTQAMEGILAKSRACSLLGQIVLPPETGTPLVIHGSRQTGMQCMTGAPWSERSDIDIGVVGDARTLAIACHKWLVDPTPVVRIEHPPTRFWESAEEAAGEGLFVVPPRRSSALDRPPI